VLIALVSGRKSACVAPRPSQRMTLQLLLQLRMLRPLCLGQWPLHSDSSSRAIKRSYWSTHQCESASRRADLGRRISRLIKSAVSCIDRMRFGRSGLSSDVIALFTLQQHGGRRQPLQGPSVNASMAGLPVLPFSRTTRQAVTCRPARAKQAKEEHFPVQSVGSVVCFSSSQTDWAAWGRCCCRQSQPLRCSFCWAYSVFSARAQRRKAHRALSAGVRYANIPMHPL
jgi:hypothetical protein